MKPKVCAQTNCVCLKFDLVHIQGHFARWPLRRRHCNHIVASFFAMLELFCVFLRNASMDAELETARYSSRCCKVFAMSLTLEKFARLRLRAASSELRRLLGPRPRRHFCAWLGPCAGSWCRVWMQTCLADRRLVPLAFFSRLHPFAYSFTGGGHKGVERNFSLNRLAS